MPVRIMQIIVNLSLIEIFKSKEVMRTKFIVPVRYEYPKHVGELWMECVPH